MSNFGFGFPSNDNDDEDDKDKNNIPNFGFLFGTPGANGMNFSFAPGNGKDAGNLGDLLNQFGAMLSGFGQDINSPESQGAVNYSLAERVARQEIGEEKKPGSNDSQAVADSIRLVELWLDEATVLPAGAQSSTAFSPTQWLEETLPQWKRILTPLAEQLNSATLDQIPEEARESAGPVLGIMNQVNGMNFGMQLGHALGQLAKTATTSTEWGIPLANGHTAAVSTAELESLSKILGAAPREVLIYLCAREAAHHRLFQHIPSLRERLILDVEEFAAGLSLDYSSIEEATREFNPETLNDPEKLQEMMSQLQESDLSPTIVSSNAHARTRLETSLSLVEGWVDVVVATALAERLPEATTINIAWQQHRKYGIPAIHELTTGVGISLVAPLADEAADLWQRLTVAVGQERRDEIWNHSDFLPNAEDLESPAGFIDSVIARGEGTDDFDPIGEIQKLEEMLKNEAENNSKDSEETQENTEENPDSDS